MKSSEKPARRGKNGIGIKKNGEKNEEKEKSRIGSTFQKFALCTYLKPKVDLFDPEWKGSVHCSFHVADNILDSLLAICIHSSQKTTFMASNCHFGKFATGQWVN